MRVTTTLGAAALIAAVTATAGAAQQPEHNMAAMAQGAAPAAVAECAQAQPQVLQTIEAADRRLELARQTNSPAAMRIAVDDLQGALRQLRAQLSACAGLQTAAAANPQAGHVMPGGQPMANTAQAPAAAPDPHAGHVMPGAPAASANAQPAVTPQAPAAAARSAAPASRPPAAAPAGQGMANMPGHNMADMKPAGASAAQPGAMPPAAANDMAGPAMTTAANPAARLADLTCQPAVDPKTAPRATYNGKAYYFCSAADRDQFLESPAKYLQR
jgi:YHS domain-containing protein